MTPDSFQPPPTEPEDTPPESENAAAGAQDSASLGSTLRQERIRQNKSLKEVAEATCIHINTLQALEEDDRSQLPAEVFVRGFISIYAQHLGLDAQEALNKYGREATTKWVTPGTAHKRRKVVPRKPRSAAPKRRFPLVITLACLAGLLGYWGYQQGDLPTVDEGGISALFMEEPGSPEEEPASALVPDERVATSLLEPASREDQEELPKGENDQPLPQSDQIQQTPLQPTAPDAQPVVAVSSPAEPTPLKESAAASVPAPEEPQQVATAPPAPDDTPPPAERTGVNYVLRAQFTETTWLRVRVDDQKPAEYTFRPGQQYTWKANDRINLFLGNAGGVDLILNGQSLPKPGGSGRTVKLSIPE